MLCPIGGLVGLSYAAQKSQAEEKWIAQEAPTKRHLELQVSLSEGEDGPLISDLIAKVEALERARAQKVPVVGGGASSAVMGGNTPIACTNNQNLKDLFDRVTRLEQNDHGPDVSSAVVSSGPVDTEGWFHRGF